MNNNDCIEENNIIEPKTKQNVKGYIIKDNTFVSFLLSNKNIIEDKININNYYYTTLNNRVLKIRTNDISYYDNLTFKIIPDNTYTYLEATKRLTDKLFVVSVNYEVLSFNPLYNNSINSNIANSNVSNIYKNEEGEYIEKRNIKFYFKLVSEGEFNIYKQLNNEKEKKLKLGENGELIRPIPIS